MHDPLGTPEDAIIQSWHLNAAPWVRAVQSGAIASRKAVTDQAIIDAVLDAPVSRVLDVGCGEGWLARALGRRSGIDVFGVDIVPALIDEARRLGGATFEVCTYDEAAQHVVRWGRFDAVVCNFSLLGDTSVENLIGGVAAYLHPRGRFILQTLHPMVACGAAPYRDGWRDGSWSGFGPGFTAPAPWYFRTMGGWYGMLRRCGFDVIHCREPVAPEAAAPSSLIFICQQRPSGSGIAA